jgi:hypothetical protein
MRLGRVPARSAALLVASWATIAVVTAWAAPASATAYRYWSYWHGTSGGGWTFSPVGATYRPPAGSVDGWRFAVSGTAGSVKPRAAASYTSICSHHSAAPAGQKLVGLVVDYGTAADAPPGQTPPRGVDTFCAQVADSGTSAQVLQQYATVRTESGLVCGIDGYPSGECGAIVQAPTTQPSPRPTTHRPAPTASTPRTRSGGATAPAGAGAATTSAAATHSTGSGSTTEAGSPSPSSPSAAGPKPVAVGAFGVPDPRGSGAGPPLGALAGGALVLLLGGAAAVRAVRSSRARDQGAPDEDAP